LLKGVVETVIKDSPIMNRLPFIEIVGNGLTYNKENALPSVDFYDVGDSWGESTPTFTQVTAVLKIMGGDADVDNFVRKTRQNIQDIEKEVIKLKAKSIRHKFEDTFIYGDVATNPKQFSGLKKIINTASAGNQVVACGAAGATLTLDMLDKMIDAHKGGKPDLLLMSARSRRKIAALCRVDGMPLLADRDQYGQYLDFWNGVPIGVSDWILDTHTVAGSVETDTVGDTCSTIYAMSFGEGALCGLTAPGYMAVEPIGSLETKDATRTRIKWYTSLALFSQVKAAALIGVKD
jgi:HK97 family phage major capsid protein